MSFDTNIALFGNKLPVYILELEGDLHLSLDSTSGWSAVTADATGIATTTTCKEGAAGITYNKSGTGAASGGIQNSTLTAFDLTDSAYRTVWVYLPSLTNVVDFRVSFGQDASNRYSWVYLASALRAGWNRLYMDLNVQGAGVSLNTQGSPSASACDFCRFTLTLAAAANTMSGIIVDAVRKHPYRYSTGEVTSPVASTKQGWMDTPTVQPNSERVQEGRVNVGAVSVVLVDAGAATVINDLDDFHAFGGQESQLKMGFSGEAEDPNVDPDSGNPNYRTIQRGVVFEPQHMGHAWRIQIHDVLEKFDVPIVEDATEASPVTITGNIVTVLLQLALSTGNATNNPTYDTLTAVRGAGVHADHFDITTIETERDTWLLNDTCSFTFRKPEPSLLTWMFREVFLAYGIVPVVKPDGRFSIKVVRPPFGAEASATFNADNVITPMPQFTFSMENLKNQVTIRHTYDSADDEFDGVTIQADATSQTAYGVRDLTIESKGIASSTVAQRVAKRILARLGNGAPPIEFDTLGTQQPRELGETAFVTHEGVPDLEAGAYGVTAKLCEITTHGFNPATGSCPTEVSLTSYQVGNYRFIGPSSMTGPYDSNTATQNANYGSISDSSNLLGTANDPTHVIGPG